MITLKTNKGDIVIQLNPEKAPKSCENFIQYVKDGFYDGTIFHRVIPDFVIQGGDPEGTGMGGPGHHIHGEFTKNGFKNDLKHTKGVLSMARASSPNSAGSQFFIMAGDVPYLDGNYAAFGKVIEGIEEVDRIVASPRNAQDRPKEDQVMKKVTVDTFGEEYEEPETL